MRVPREVALSLGSNLGERREHLAAALRRIESGPLTDVRVSSLYETVPIGVDGEQPDYLNLCVLARSDRTVGALLRYCQALEAAAGRGGKGLGLPRTLDVDLLFVGQDRCHTAQLELPHPRLSSRRFVLEPLAEIAPDWRHPDDGSSVLDLLERLGPDQELHPLATPEGWWRLEQTC